MSSSPHRTRLLQSLLGGAVGAGVGAGAGAAFGAATAPAGQRKEEAKKWARKGAIGGAVGGAVVPFYRPVASYFVGKNLEQEEKVLRDLYLRHRAGDLAHDLPGLIGNQESLVERVQKLQAKLTMPLPHMKLVREAAVSSTLNSAAGVLGNRLHERINSRKDAQDNTKSAENTPMRPGGISFRVTMGKYANDPLAPQMGEPLQTEIPNDRRARRLAELLKRSMPTGTAEGSSSPTPKRGTP